MGLLEQLEREVEQKHRHAAATLSEERQRALHWAEQLLPAMRSLDVYMSHLVGELGRVRPTVRLIAPLPGYGDVVAYLDHKYTLRAQPGDDSYEIALEYSAAVASDECPERIASTPAEVTALTDALWKQRLFGMQQASKNDDGDVVAARFRARGRIPMKLRIFADAASGCARLHGINLEGFGHSSRTFSAQQLTLSMFDSLGRFIAGDEPGFCAPRMTDPAERRLRARRNSGLRLKRSSEAPWPGRRSDDMLVAARLRPWLASGAMPERPS